MPPDSTVAPIQLADDVLREVARVKFDPRPLQELIEALGYTPYRFALTLGTSTANVSRWLAGRAPAGAFMLRILALAKAARIDFDLLSGVKKPPPPAGLPCSSETVGWPDTRIAG